MRQDWCSWSRCHEDARRATTAGSGGSHADRDSNRRAHEESRLSKSVEGLAALASVSLPLTELLTRVARHAVQAIPGADGAGLTLIEADRADMGVHSVVSLPLPLGDGVVGAINVYAFAHDAFDERAAELGEAYAAPAAIAVQHAHVLEQTRRLAQRLQTSLEAQMVIEQAIGVVVGRRASRRERHGDAVRRAAGRGPADR